MAKETWLHGGSQKFAVEENGRSNGAHVGGFMGMVICCFKVETSATSAVVSWSTEVVAMLRIQADKRSEGGPRCCHVCLDSIQRGLFEPRLPFARSLTQHTTIKHPEQSPTPTPPSPR